MSLPRLARLIPQVGVKRVKYPLWHDPRRGEELIDELVAFGERLGGHEIELVGLLDGMPRREDDRTVDAGLAGWQVPDNPREGHLGGTLPSHGTSSAAEVFTQEPKPWYPRVEPLMSRLATRVRWWQLGDDKDTGFVEYANLAGQIGQVKAELDRIGRDVNLGMGWGWLNELPQAPAGKAPWRFLAFSADPPMTHRELATHLDATKDSNLQRWVAIEPLARDRYPLEVRAGDLVRRMIAAKIHGAEAISCPNPFSTQHGLLNDDGTPGELLFAWRTTAQALGGAEYLGSIRLPGGSPNQIFARDGDMVMVVWNDRPTDEVIYLGEEVRRVDLWGHTTSPPKQGHRQVIWAERLPSFVTGLHGPITRWRHAVALAETRIPSVRNRSHGGSFRLTNHFARPVVGRATLIAPDLWRVHPPQSEFSLPAGGQSEQPFEITLPHNADCSRHPIRIDFELDAEQHYRFSVYRRMEVGSRDVEIEIVTRLNDRGELEVEQRMINRSDGPVSFRCQLFAPNRGRRRTQIIDLAPGRDNRVYRLADGRELIGTTLWLRAEEVRGSRVLNYRFPAEP